MSRYPAIDRLLALMATECEGCGAPQDQTPTEAVPGRGTGWKCPACGWWTWHFSNSPPSSANTAEAAGAKDGDLGSNPSEGGDLCDKCGTPMSEWETTLCVRSLTQSPRHTITRFHVPIPGSEA